MAEGQVLDAIEENLPEDEDPREWNWEALAKMVNTRWKLNLRDRDLKQARPRSAWASCSSSRPARPSKKIDLSEGARFLETISACGPPAAGCSTSSASSCDPAEVRELEPTAFKQLVREKAAAGLRREGNRVPGDGRAVPLHHPRRQRPQARTTARSWSPGPASGSTSSSTLEDLEEPAARRDPRPAGRAQPGPASSKPTRPWPKRTRQVDKLFGVDAARANGRRRQRRQRRARPRWPIGCGRSLHYRAAAREAGAARPRAARAAAGGRRRRPLPARDAADGAVAGAANSRHRLEGPPAGDGPPAQQRRPARLRPGRSQGRVQARGHADLRADVELGRRARHRPDLPHGAARRGLRRLDLDREPRPSTRTPSRPARSPTSSRRPSTARRPTTSPSRSATASSASAATTLPLRQRQEVQELLHEEERREL